LGGVLGFVFFSAVFALDVPPLTGRIVDSAHLLSLDQAGALSAELAAHEQRTGNQVALLTIPTLEGEPLEEYSHRVATTWRLGQKDRDNGVLLLVVPADRKVRIEVGYGLEGILTDLKASRIIRNEIVPLFKAGRYAEGITGGLRAIMRTLEGTSSPPETTAHTNSASPVWNALLIAVFIGVVAGLALSELQKGVGLLGGGVLSFLVGLSAGWLVAVIASAVAVIGSLFLFALLPRGAAFMRGGYFNGAWSGSGGFSGGGFSGGGGDFGGGGASGRW
jgi:uncharacterized protein